MSRVLLAWELGGGYGHVVRLAPLARELARRGHQVVCAMRDLPAAARPLGGSGIPLLQAPLWVHASALPPSLNYAELLQRCGYLETSAVHALVRGWLNLYELYRPELVLLDHSPTALLAARVAGLRRALLGNGFASPPRLTPMPTLQPWKRVPRERLLAAEERVLAVLNGVLGELGSPPLGALCELFEAEADFLCVFPEFDHYAEREPREYFGFVTRLAGAGGADRAPRHEAQILLYMSASWAPLAALLTHLRELRIPTLAHVRDALPGALGRFESDTLRFSAAPLDFAATGGGCRLGICHGGVGSAAALILGGVPVLVLPQHLEQAMFGHRLVAAGAAFMVNPADRDTDFSAILRRALEESTAPARAAEIASRYAEFDYDAQPGRLADRCEAILGAA